MSHPSRWSSFFAAAAFAVLTIPAPAPAQTLFEGARLITGDGGVIENSAFLVTGNRISQAGRKGEVPLPSGGKRVDLTGKTVMPALIDAHVHMGYRKGLDFSTNNYTRENLSDILERFAYYGVAAILEAGTARSELPYEFRANPPPGAMYLTAGRGFGMPNAGPGGPMRDSAYGVRTEAEARADVRELAGKKPNMVKIWVDDRGGTVEKLHPDLYRAIIDEAHKNNMRVFAHVTKLEDVKDLLRTGIDGFAHRARTSRDPRRTDPNGGDPRRHAQFRRRAGARSHGKHRGRQKRRFPRARRQPARQHFQHAQNRQGVSAGD